MRVNHVEFLGSERLPNRAHKRRVRHGRMVGPGTVLVETGNGRCKGSDSLDWDAANIFDGCLDADGDNPNIVAQVLEALSQAFHVLLEPTHHGWIEIGNEQDFHASTSW